MMNGIERRPFSELGDQQLLEQTKRLAANQRCLEVHILEHLDEIDRRGLALRRGFSSLFDYAVRELRFTDAAAQRRIPDDAAVRRHGWVRDCLQSGELSLTSAAQLETTFAGAERAERQNHTGHRNVGQGRGHDQDHDSVGSIRQLGLRAAPGEADEQGERGHRSASAGAAPAGECTGEVAAGNTPAVAVASRSGAQAPGGVHTGGVAAADGVDGNAAPGTGALPRFRCCSGCRCRCRPRRAVIGRRPCSTTSAATEFSASMPEPEPVTAPAESLHAAAHAPEPPRDDPFAELSPVTVSAAPLLHPQRQRELIEQAAGMSTRQVASLLAAAAPEVLPPRDTLRAVAPDRYTLKVSIDQECEQGLRLLKDLMAHLDPRMSWGDLVARVVREAVARHDPRGGGRGQRRKGADSASASPRRTPKETRATGAATGAAGGPAQRVDESLGRGQNRTRAAVAPVAPARRRGGATPALPGDTAATEKQNPIGVLASAAPPSQSAPAAPLDGAHAGGAPAGASTATAAPQSAPAAPLDVARADGAPAGAPAATAAPQSAPAALLDVARADGARSSPSAVTSAPQFASGALADGSHAGAAVPGSPVATSAPQPALGESPDGAPNGTSTGAAGVASADGFSAGAGVPGSPVATSAPKSVLGVFPDGGPPDAAAGAAAHTSREPVHSSRESPRRRHIPAAVRRHIWQRDGGRCCYRDPLSGRRCTSSHLLQIDHLLPVAEGGGPEPSNLAL